MPPPWKVGTARASQRPVRPQGAKAGRGAGRPSGRTSRPTGSAPPAPPSGRQTGATGPAGRAGRLVPTDRRPLEAARHRPHCAATAAAPLPASPSPAGAAHRPSAGKRRAKNAVRRRAREKRVMTMACGFPRARRLTSRAPDISGRAGGLSARRSVSVSTARTAAAVAIGRKQRLFAEF